MGFNTTVLIMNDACGCIEQDPDFGKKIVAAINGLSLNKHGDRGIDISSGYNANAATVIETHHNSSTALVAVGGNYAHVLGWAGDVPHHTDEGKLKCLEALAEHFGYRLVKKPEKKT